MVFHSDSQPIDSPQTPVRMTPRERWIALFEGRQPDRLPTDYWATREFHRKLKQHLRIEDDETLWQTLGIDRPCFVGPKQIRNFHHPDDPRANIWGVRETAVSYGTGEYQETDFHPLENAESADEIHDFKWPSPDDWDYSVVKDAIARNAGYRLVQGGSYEPFLLWCAMRGMEQAFEDMILEPEITEAGLSHIFEFHLEFNRRIWEAGEGGIDMMYLAEDLGAQTGPLMSLDCYRHFLRPHQEQMARAAKEHGVRVFYHTDGAARSFLQDLIEVVGIDILNPIQWRCPGMERDGLASDFGSGVIFHGAIDNQHTLAFGSPEDVRREVVETAELFAGCQWICAPCHNIQNISPVENVLALYQEAHRIGSKES